jgi:hypothetical protein
VNLAPLSSFAYWARKPMVAFFLSFFFLPDAWKPVSCVQGFTSWTLYRPLGYSLYGKENKEGDSQRKRTCEQETRSLVGLIVNVPEGSKP